MPRAPEIRNYFEHVAQKYAVVDRVRFEEEITACEFIDGRWQIRTSQGREDRADIIIAATGVLHHPNRQDFPGLDTFEGVHFHSAEWDHSVPLDGARVGVVGTGSTAIQITTALVERVAHYSLFQRTAQWVFKMENDAYAATERAAFANDPPENLRATRRAGGLFLTISVKAVIDSDSPEMKEIEAVCLANLEETVKDPELREKLRPNYRAACKRLILSPNFYECIQHPNAELVVSGIEAVEPKGVRTRDGKLHELDVLVLATGFRADRFIRPTLVRGRGGVDLDDVWADHPVAYLSISIPEFPNFFMLNGPNGPVGNFSLIRIAELQLGYILQLMEKNTNRRVPGTQRQSPGHGRLRAVPAPRPPRNRFGPPAAIAGIWTSTACRQAGPGLRPISTPRWPRPNSKPTMLSESAGSVGRCLRSLG